TPVTSVTEAVRRPDRPSRSYIVGIDGLSDFAGGERPRSVLFGLRFQLCHQSSETRLIPRVPPDAPSRRTQGSSRTRAGSFPASPACLLSCSPCVQRRDRPIDLAVARLMVVLLLAGPGPAELSGRRVRYTGVAD